MGGHRVHYGWAAILVLLTLTLWDQAAEWEVNLPESLRRQPNVIRLAGRAAEGDSNSQASLGDYCFSVKAFPEAVYWYTRAAAGGSVSARCSLAKCYQEGLGVAKDPAEAKRWADLARTQQALPGESQPAEPEPPLPKTPAEGIRQTEPGPSVPSLPSPGPENPEPRIDLGKESERLIDEWFRSLKKPIPVSRRVLTLQPPDPALLEISLDSDPGEAPPARSKPEL